MDEKKWYQKNVAETLLAQKTTKDGLTMQEAAQRLHQYGQNKLQEETKKSIPQLFLSQFQDLLVIILLIAAFISLLSGNYESTLVIVAVLLLNALLGTVQYVKAEKSLESLKAMSSPTAKVFRDGEKRELASPNIVPGDIILLEAGDMVVADGRLLENYSLKVNESSLTGESEAVEKTTEAISAQKVALGDQKNMVFSGSLVTYGRALMVVTATGMDTELGRIAALMNQTKQRKTPLQKSLDDFSGKLAIVILVICLFVFVLSFFRSGLPLLDSLMFAVALAVAAIPEALSSIVTIVLAMGTQKMARANAIIKDLKAVESLGSVQVICSDKTGTLTQNKMTVQHLYTDGKCIDRSDFSLDTPAKERLCAIALLANDATVTAEGGIGDPTEVALVQLGRDLGISEQDYRASYPRQGELAFDSDRKLMSTVHTIHKERLLFTKGAMDVMLRRCTQIQTADGIRPITKDDVARIEETNRRFSENGLRVLSFGFRPLDASSPLTLAEEKDFVFVGLISMIDPPRKESAQAVSDARRGGIRTIMITGDHKVTATAIAKEIGIFQEGDLALDGLELDAMGEEQLDRILPQVSVYARVSPEHKIRIVSAWQRRGAIVSMTGDGVNDAPALKQADIGVAMGITGTEVSKDAASMILADDNFATIVQAVVNGRGVYTNIKNAIGFLLSGNTAGILAVLYASIANLPTPFAPVHLLFINLLTDSMPAIAIGMEPARDGLLDQKPRDPSQSILDRPLLARIGAQGLLIAIAAMAAFYLGLSSGGADQASTMAFATLTLARLFHGFNCRGKESIFAIGFTSNPYSLLAFAGGILLLGFVLMLPPLKGLFEVAPLLPIQYGQIMLLAVLPTILIQLLRLKNKRS